MELSESARIDGLSNEFGIFLRIILRYAKQLWPPFAIFAFMNSWNDYLGPLLYINSASRLYDILRPAQFQMEHDRTGTC
jgi:multiple sugar transport system permease protein